MKRCYNYITGFLGLLTVCCHCSGQIIATTQQTYTSVNPKANTTTTFRGMLYLDYKRLFRFNADLAGGIIGDISGGGKITLKVYTYDDSKPDGKGKLVWGVYSDQTSSSYAAKTWNEVVDVVVDEFQNLYEINGPSSQIKKLCQRGRVFIPNDQGSASCKDYEISLSNAGKAVWNVLFNTITLGGATRTGQNTPLNCNEYFQEQQPVIVEATLNNATFKKAKIPGMGEFDAAELFLTAIPFSAINGKVTLASHRGNWQDVLAPENTKNSIADMIAENYDMVELDLWNTLDNQIIVFHDMGLNKRTTQTGGVRSKNWSDISSLYTKNRFDELISTSNTKIELLSSILDYIKQQDPNRKVYLNLDRSANDMNIFKLVYGIVADKGLLDRAIFKGRFNPDADGEIAPTVASIKQAFTDMFPALTQTQRDDKMKLMRYTPVLFDNSKGGNTTNDNAFATRIKQYIDSMINAGIADGFELNFKSYPVGSADFANATDDNVFLLKQWSALGNQDFVQYVHSKGLPVGIFASVPEVCAIPDFNSNGTRNPASLVSGFVKEDLTNNFTPNVKPQGNYDFRGDWDFYIPAGVDYVITDRPDALREFLKAIGRFQ